MRMGTSSEHRHDNARRFDACKSAPPHGAHERAASTHTVLGRFANEKKDAFLYIPRCRTAGARAAPAVPGAAGRSAIVSAIIVALPFRTHNAAHVAGGRSLGHFGSTALAAPRSVELVAPAAMPKTG